MTFWFLTESSILKISQTQAFSDPALREEVEKWTTEIMDVINFTIRDRNILNGLRERGKELKLQGKYLKKHW